MAEWAKLEFDVTPWDDPAYYREHSAGDLRRPDPDAARSSSTPSTTSARTIGQAEALVHGHCARIKSGRYD